MTAQPMVIACPCGGYSLTLPADKLPVGGRAAFTCPACGLRRTCVRTERGIVVDDQSAPDAASGPLTPPTPIPEPTPQPEQRPEASPLGASPALPADGLPPPSPVPPAARIALAVVAEADWAVALGQALAPDWHVLYPESPGQALADFLALAPGVVLLDTGDTARAVQTAADALPGRSREGLTLLALLPCPDADALAAFAHSADAALDGRNHDAKAERLRIALEGAATLPSLFAGERG